jgi:hypothetical protein
MHENMSEPKNFARALLLAGTGANSHTLTFNL